MSMDGLSARELKRAMKYLCCPYCGRHYGERSEVDECKRTCRRNAREREKRKWTGKT